MVISAIKTLSILGWRIVGNELQQSAGLTRASFWLCRMPFGVPAISGLVLLRTWERFRISFCVVRIVDSWSFEMLWRSVLAILVDECTSARISSTTGFNHTILLLSGTKNLGEH